MQLLPLKFNFILMEHQGIENYFSLKETDLGLQTAGAILSVTEGRPSNTKNGFFASQRLPTCERNSSRHLFDSKCASLLPPAPVGVPITFLTLLTKHYLPMGSFGAQL